MTVYLHKDVKWSDKHGYDMQGRVIEVVGPCRKAMTMKIPPHPVPCESYVVRHARGMFRLTAKEIWG